MWEPHLEHSDLMSGRRQKNGFWLKLKQKICSLIIVIKSQYFNYGPFTHHPTMSEHKRGRCCCWRSVKTLNSTESETNIMCDTSTGQSRVLN